jgi:NAD(P)-dependent dehydrogenase (short-subunit alcohol dehydrogenase family)
MEQTPKEFQHAIKEWIESGWTPIRRQGTVDDIADVCAILCSEEARFLTGHALSVDGGSSLMNSDFPLPLQVPV